MRLTTDKGFSRTAGILGLLAIFAALGSAGSADAKIYEVGEKAPAYCWNDVNERQVCLSDPELSGKVVVLLYNAGWCPPCNAEFRHLVEETAEFANRPVVFVSLSFEGWARRKPADSEFLQQWQTRHRLDQALATVVVAGSPGNPGRDFFRSPAIPNVAILDVDHVVAYKAINPGLKAIAREVRALLPRVVPTN